MSDRIAVMYRGRIVGDRRRADGGQERGRPADGDRRRRRARRPRRRASPGPARDRARGAAAPAPRRPGRGASGGRRPAARRRSCSACSSARSSSSARSCCVAGPHVRPGRCRSPPTCALLEGSLGSPSAIVNTLVDDRPARPRRAVGRPRLQGRPVQHRRPGPVPDRAPSGRSSSASRWRDQPPIDRDPASRSLAGIARRRRSGASSRASSRRSRAPTRSSPRSCSTTSRSRSWPGAVSGPLKVPGSPSPITYDVGNAALPDHHRRQRPPRDHPDRARRWSSSSGGCSSGRRSASRSGPSARTPMPRATPGCGRSG